MFLIGEYRPRLLLILLVAGLAMAGLPVAGFIYLKYFETEMVQKTEGPLVTQGALVGVMYRSLFSPMSPEQVAKYAEKFPSVPRDWGAPRHEIFGTGPGILNLRFDPIKPKLVWSHRSSTKSGDGLNTDIRYLLGQTLEAMKAATGAEIHLIDPITGSVVVSGWDQDFTPMSLENDELLKTIRAGKVFRSLHRNNAPEPHPLVSMVTHLGSISVVVGFPIIMSDHVVAAVVFSKTPGNMINGIKNNRDLMEKAFLALFVSILLSVIFLSLTITRPVRAVMDQTRRAMGGERGAVRPIHRTVTREMKDLAIAVSEMAAELENRAYYAMDYAALVSHEFKTPLTPVLSNSQSLRESWNTMTPEMRNERLTMIARNSEKLDKLVDGLLELAEAEYVEVKKTDRCKANEVLQEIQKHYASSQIIINIDQVDDGIEVAISATRLSSVLGSLIENAIEHGSDDANVSITCCYNGDAERSVQIRVSNEGQGISKANAEKIFDRFFTTARDKGSRGLGLSIVKILIKAHGGSIELIQLAAPTTFEIVLPLR